MPSVFKIIGGDRLWKLIGRDGLEYGPLGKSDIRAMYRDGRVTKDTLVFVPGRSQWALLADVFDVGKWAHQTNRDTDKTTC